MRDLVRLLAETPPSRSVSLPVVRRVVRRAEDLIFSWSGASGPPSHVVLDIAEAGLASMRRGAISNDPVVASLGLQAYARAAALATIVEHPNEWATHRDYLEEHFHRTITAIGIRQICRWLEGDGKPLHLVRHDGDTLCYRFGDRTWQTTVRNEWAKANAVLEDVRLFKNFRYVADGSAEDAIPESCP